MGEAVSQTPRQDLNDLGTGERGMEMKRNGTEPLTRCEDEAVM